MDAFLIGSGWVFWALMVLFIIVATPFIESDESEVPLLGPFLTLVIIGAILYFTNRALGINERLIDIVQHPVRPLFYLGVYIIAGIIWSFIKWYQLLLRFKNADSHNRSYRFKTAVVDGIKIPVAAENKARLTSWLMFWPLSLTWFAVHKPFTSIYEWLADSYNRIARSVLKDLYTEKEKE